jgi:uncharacterized protein
MRRWIKRLLILLAALAILIAILIADRGSRALVAPARRVLQDFHRTILADQPTHGLKVHDFFSPSGAPGLLILPSSHPGAARKSRDLRAELERRGLQLPAFGETIGTIVMFYGRDGRREDNLPIAERFCAAGFACISCDLPGHGDSPSPYATFGHNERHDLPGILAAANDIQALPESVALFGYSQGGAIALQTAAEPGNHCFAVISIATFADLGTIVEQQVRSLHPSTRTTGLVRLGTRLRAGFDPADIRPAESASHIDSAVFILHGADDTVIAPSNGQRIYDAVSHSDKRLQIIPRAGHGNVLLVGGNTLYADLTEFYLQHLPK